MVINKTKKDVDTKPVVITSKKQCKEVEQFIKHQEKKLKKPEDICNFVRDVWGSVMAVIHYKNGLIHDAIERMEKRLAKTG